MRACSSATLPECAPTYKKLTGVTTEKHYSDIQRNCVPNSLERFHSSFYVKFQFPMHNCSRMLCNSIRVCMCCLHCTLSTHHVPRQLSSLVHRLTHSHFISLSSGNNLSKPLTLLYLRPPRPQRNIDASSAHSVGTATSTTRTSLQPHHATHAPLLSCPRL